MNNLQIFKEEQLIPLQQNNDGEVIISGRELHAFLEVKTKYKDWFPRMKEYGFVENTDFIAIAQKRATAQGNETTYIDHAIKLDMAKELAMIQRNEKGKQARQYFIQVEKAWNSPEMIMKRALEYANRSIENLKLENEEQKKQLKEQQPKVMFADTVASTNKLLLVREVAKLASDEGIKIGEKRLWNKLREWGLICKNSTEPKQYGIDNGWFKVVEGTRSNSKGTFIYNTTKVTGKGQVYIISKLKREVNPAMLADGIAIQA